MEKNKKSLYLLDAFALIYRSYYAFIKNPRITSTGINTSAAFGFTNFLIDLIERENPSHIAVIFDPKGPTFRHTMYKPYKAQRPPMPEDLRNSIPYIQDIIKGFGIKAFDAPGYEADDLIGTLAKKAEKDDYKVYMITPDKDYAQLVSDNIFMYKPGRSGNQNELWGIPEVLDHFGIERIPQVIDILGLMGDTADNVPGCAGIGPKSAAKLVYQFGSIEGIYQNIDKLKGKQKENLLNCKNTVELSKTLVTINTEVPTEFSSEDLERGKCDEDILKPIFDELELFSLKERILKVENQNNPTYRTLEDVKTSYVKKNNQIVELINELKACKEYAITAVFKNGNIYNSNPSQLYFCTVHHFVSIIDLPQNEKVAKETILLFKDIFEDESKTIISAESKDNIIWLRRNNINLKNKIFDITIAHYLLHPDMSHDISRIALEKFEYQMGKEKLRSNQLDLFDQISAEDETYSEKTDICQYLKDYLLEELKVTGLLNLYLNVEIPLIGVLAKMEYEGVYVDTKALDELSNELNGKLNLLEKKIYELSGEEFNINSPKQMGIILFDKLKIGGTKIKKTKSGNYSTSEQILNKLEEDNEIVKFILEYRSLKKLVSNYSETLPSYIDSATQRIHTRFNQSEAATGRLNSANPNLQNIPIRSEDGRKIRKAFGTEREDCVFVAADYSQVELRIMASLSNTPELIQAFKNGEDIHASTASKIYHTPLSEVTSEMRRRAKTANFGIIYGISAWGLAERLHISRKEGKELIEGYFTHYPGVKKYMDECVEKAKKQKYVETIMSRRRYLHDINSKNAIVRGIAERNAINAPIQGSAADIIKMAMIQIDRKMTEAKLKSKLVIQVHDELDFICYKDELETLKTIIKESMEHVVELQVPLTVSIGVGKNWFEAH